MKATKQSATLAVCLFAGTCTAAMAGSQSLLDSYNYVGKTAAPLAPLTKGGKPPAEGHTPLAPSTLQDAETTTTTQYVKMPGMETPASEKHEKKTKVADTSAGHGLISGVNDKVRSAGSGIVGGGGQVAKAAGEGIEKVGGGIASGTRKMGGGIAAGAGVVGGGIANGSKKVGDGIATSAKASGAFFIKGAHVMGSGLKAATGSIPGFGHKKSDIPTPVVAKTPTPPAPAKGPASAGETPVAQTPGVSGTVAETPVTQTPGTQTPVAAAPAADMRAKTAPVAVAQKALKPEKNKLAILGILKHDKSKNTLPALKPDKVKSAPEAQLAHEKVKNLNPSNQLVHEKVKGPREGDLIREKVKKEPEVQLASPGVIGKTMNKLTFWKHKDNNGPAVQATASKDDPGKIVR